jgi:hypothetical protein
MEVQRLYPPGSRFGDSEVRPLESHLNSQHLQASQVADGYLEPTPDRH